MVPSIIGSSEQHASKILLATRRVCGREFGRRRIVFVDDSGLDQFGLDQAWFSPIRPSERLNNAHESGEVLDVLRRRYLRSLVERRHSMLRALKCHGCLLVVGDVAAIPSDNLQEFYDVRILRGHRELVGPFDLARQRRGTLSHHQGVSLLDVLGEHSLLFNLNVHGLLPEVNLPLIRRAPACGCGVVVYIDHNKLQVSDRLGYARAIRVRGLYV